MVRIDRYCEESPAVKSIWLLLALVIVLTMIIAGCSGTTSLPYVGPIDGGAGAYDDGGVTPNPPDDGVTPPSPPTGDNTGGLAPPSPPIF